MPDREKLTKPCSPEVDKSRNELQKSALLRYHSHSVRQQAAELVGNSKKAIAKSRKLCDNICKLKAG